MRRTLVATICAAFTSCCLLAGCKQSVPKQEPENTAAEKSQRTNLKQRPPTQVWPATELSEKPDKDGRISAKEDRLARLLMVLLEERHLRRKPFNDDVSRVAFDAFLESLDPGRLFLLQDDVDALRTYATKIDDEVKNGRFDLAFRGGKRLARRIKAVREDVAEMLQKPFDLDDNSTFQTDSEKRPYAQTMEELSVIWRKTLQLQAIRRIDSRLEAQKKSAESKKTKGQKKSSPNDGNPPPKTAKSKTAEPGPAVAPLKSVNEIEVDVRQTLAKRYDARFKRLIQLDAVDHIERLVDAIAEAYDPHTSYLPPARKEDFDIRMSGKLEGIGAVLQEDDDVIKVARIMAGSASDRQGDLKAEDYIIAVAQGDEEPTDIVGMRLRDAVRLIRGPKGTTVKLTVRKPDERQIIIPIVRDVVRLEATWARAAILSHKTGGRTGYIELPSFYGSTGQRKPGEKPRTSSGDVRRALEAFNDKGVDRVILDLRNNGGGYLTDARRMAGLFIETGPVVQTRTADGELDSLVDKNPEVTFDGLAVVMVDHQSASASEIVAGALKDYNRAVIIGTSNTHGKGTVQTLLNLDELTDRLTDGLGVIKITQAQFYRVNGESTQLRGVVPDIQLPDPSAYIESGESALDRPIPWDAIAPAKYTPWQGHTFDIASLKEKSERRVKNDKALTLVDQRVAVLKRQIDKSVYSLSLKKWQARRIADDAALEALQLPEDDNTLFDAKPSFYAGDYSDSEQKTLTDWSKTIQTDPWINEALNVMGDMVVQTK